MQLCRAGAIVMGDAAAGIAAAVGGVVRDAAAAQIDVSQDAVYGAAGAGCTFEGIHHVAGDAAAGHREGAAGKPDASSAAERTLVAADASGLQREVAILDIDAAGNTTATIGAVEAAGNLSAALTVADD